MENQPFLPGVDPCNQVALGPAEGSKSRFKARVGSACSRVQGPGSGELAGVRYS